MKRLTGAVLLIVIAACSKASAPPASNEVTYPMTATIISRDPANNTLNLDNKEVPGKMMAMKMEYEVRDAKVDSLPRDGSAVVVKMHDQKGRLYITDVKPMK